MTAVRWNAHAPGHPPDAADLRHLWRRLGLVERRIRDAVVLRQSTDPAPNDPYRGLYITDEAVARILDGPPSGWDTGAADGVDAVRTDDEPAAGTVRTGSRLGRLAATFGLSGVDVEFLVIALAPDVDARFERLYGYLNDDVTRRRPTVGLALELCGLPAAGAARFRLTATAPLVAGGLIEVEDEERPSLTRGLRVPDRVLAHLLGDDEPDPRLAGLARLPGAPGGATETPCDLVGRIGAGIRAGVLTWHLCQTGAGDAGELAPWALAGAGHGALVVDPVALADDAEPRTALAALVREARLRDAGVVFGPLEAFEPRRPERARLLRALTSLAAGVPLLTYGVDRWDPSWAADPPLSAPVAPSDPDRQAARWRRALAEAGGGPADQVPPDALDGYRLGPEEVRRAASVAARLALLDGRPVRAEDLRAGARAQNGAGLERLARRISPTIGWDDLVLPAQTRRSLDDLVVRAQHRDRVLGRWRMRPGGGRGRGVVALFAGESGTGKTMSAEVVAAELGMELYVVDLSTVVDKYVGETEKNLERILAEAAGVNAILLFDEADAVFGKRSQVTNAHDRYANVESAFLLQRMESFDGIAVLTTNLRSNLDSAFTRRLDVVANFPMPDTAQRLVLWDRCLGPALPRADDLDLAFCAERFELSGGSIRACAVTTAYLAAASGRPAGMTELVTAVAQEYRKIGRLLLDNEFGPWCPPTN
ncbi:MAG TPA: ATP-binding protein [Mycobacteriales bacterium]|nr:ATP-binding protein [Mycobacteriales bacterium]